METLITHTLQTKTAKPSLQETAAAFWQFLKAPQQLQAAAPPLAQVWRPFLQLFVLKFVAALGLSALVYGFISLLGLDPFSSHKLDSFLQDNHFAVALLVVAVAAPVIEEFFFRAPLRYTRRGLFVALLAFNFFLLPFLLESLGLSSLLRLLLGIGALMLAIAFVLSDTWSEKMRQVWQQHFGAVFYTLAAVFALIHLANYDSLHLPVALIPLLVVPQFIGALFWGYVRLRFSLGWAMLGHGLFNALLLTLSYLTV